MTVDRQRNLALFAYGPGFLAPHSESQWPAPAESIRRNTVPLSPDREPSREHARRMRNACNTVYAAIGVVEPTVTASTSQPITHNQRFAHEVIGAFLDELVGCWVQALIHRLYAFRLQSPNFVDSIIADYQRLGLSEFLFTGLPISLCICIFNICYVLSKHFGIVKYGFRRLIWANCSNIESRKTLEIVSDKFIDFMAKFKQPLVCVGYYFRYLQQSYIMPRQMSIWDWTSIISSLIKPCPEFPFTIGLVSEVFLVFLRQKMGRAVAAGILAYLSSMAGPSGPLREINTSYHDKRRALLQWGSPFVFVWRLAFDRQDHTPLQQTHDSQPINQPSYEEERPAITYSFSPLRTSSS